MWDLWRIVVGAGLQDGFNPCTLMACAVFIVHGIWVSKRYSHLAILRLIFVAAYVLGLLCFNFGPMGIFLFHKIFILTAKVIYLALGATSFVLGIVFLKDWFLIHRRQAAGPTGQKTGFHARVIAIGFITFILAVVLSALATLWPVNYYMALLGTGGLLNGQWQAVLSLLTGYTITSLWPLWFLWAFLGIKTLRPALLKIVCASVFFAASSSVILFFK